MELHIKGLIPEDGKGVWKRDSMYDSVLPEFCSYNLAQLAELVRCQAKHLCSLCVVGLNHTQPALGHISRTLDYIRLHNDLNYK